MTIGAVQPQVWGLPDDYSMTEVAFICHRYASRRRERLVGRGCDLTVSLFFFFLLFFLVPGPFYATFLWAPPTQQSLLLQPDFTLSLSQACPFGKIQIIFIFFILTKCPMTINAVSRDQRRFIEQKLCAVSHPGQGYRPYPIKILIMGCNRYLRVQLVQQDNRTRGIV